MQAIISNGKRTQIYSDQLELTTLREFISKEFPRMKDVSISFQDQKGNTVSVEEQNALEQLKKAY